MTEIRPARVVADIVLARHVLTAVDERRRIAS